MAEEAAAAAQRQAAEAQALADAEAAEREAAAKVAAEVQTAADAALMAAQLQAAAAQSAACEPVPASVEGELASFKTTSESSSERWDIDVDDAIMVASDGSVTQVRLCGSADVGCDQVCM